MNNIPLRVPAVTPKDAADASERGRAKEVEDAVEKINDILSHCFTADRVEVPACRIVHLRDRTTVLTRFEKAGWSIRDEGDVFVFSEAQR